MSAPNQPKWVSMMLEDGWQVHHTGPLSSLYKDYADGVELVIRTAYGELVWHLVEIACDGDEMELATGDLSACLSWARDY